MERDELRQEIRSAMDACFACADARPSQKNRILNRIEGEATMKRKRSYGAVLALALVLALCGGAAAAQLGIFGQFGMTNEGNSERLGHLDAAANAIGTTVTSPAGFALTLEQAYCDGSRLYFAYSLTGEGMVLGDGAALLDGTTLTIWDRGDETDAHGVTRGYQEVELPGEAASGDALTVVLTVICPAEEGARRYVNVPFAVPLSARETRTGSAAFAEYRAEAALILTDVEIYVEVDVIGQVGWRDLYRRRADTDDVDYVVDYQLIADGEVLFNKDYTYGEANNGYGIPVRYDLPQRCERLVLRPVRYLSGECEAEEIVLR